MSAYAELPNAGFRDQEVGERVEVLLRRHIVTNLRWIIPVVAAIFLPTILHIIGPATIPGLDSLANIPTPTLFLAEMLWYVVIAGYALESFLIWYYNVYLITNIRLLDVDFIGLMYYSSSEAELRQVQDVSHKQQGLWQLLFNYGTVEIQTSGTRLNLIFEKVPKPHRVADIITDLLPEEAAFRQSQTSSIQPQPEEQILS